MKKILLGTTAIAGAVVLAAAAQAAEKPQLKIDGYLRFETWFTSQDLDTAQNKGVNMEMDDVEIHFQGSAVADNGLEYGFYVELQEGSSDGNAGYDEANVFLAGNWGRFDLGSQDAVWNNYKMGAYAISADKDGAWDGNNLFTSTGNAAPIITDFFGGDDANKITYYTPTFAGFTVGVSYVPDSGESLNSGLVDDKASALGTNGQLASGSSIQDELGGALRYKGEFGGVSLEGTARYMRGNANSDTQEDASAYGVGLAVGFAGFTVAGSYNDQTDSLTTKGTSDVDAGQWWDIGVAYGTGPYKVSAVFMHSWAEVGSGVDDDEVDYLQIGLGYSVAPGLDVYAAYQNVQIEQAGTAQDNDVSNFLVGTQVSF